MNNSYEDIVNTLPHSMTLPEQDGVEVPSLEDAIRHINNMDFSPIQKKLTSEDPLLCRCWSAVEAEIAIQYYRNFLFLNKKYLPTHPIIPPLLEVDEIWHHHLLDTRQYMTDSMAIFGYYFHHYPYFGTRGNDDLNNLKAAFEESQKLHELEFGSRMISVWGPPE